MSVSSRIGMLAAALCSCFGVGVLRAADVYVVRFDTLRASTLAELPCTFLSYRDDLVFRNGGTSDQIVRLLGVSNGTATDPLPLTITPGQILSSEGDAVAIGTWGPTPQPLLWVSHLDVPNDVQVVSRLLVPTYLFAGCQGGSGGSERTYAGIAMPIVRALIPAGTPQVHLATDIGGDAGGTADDGRTNVGIYNGGSVNAGATVEIRRACDGGLITTASTSVPPNTIIQVGSFSAAFEGCTAIHTASYESYVVVTVDQPSFSYAITLSNHRPPWISVSSSP
jgi:hypothetical protein